MSLEPSELESLVRARILIVEDEGIVAKDLQNSLRSIGYTVCGTSASGADAIARAEALRPDLILMDIRLRGEMDGIEAARRIRERLDVPVVFLTAYADPDTLARAADVGPYAYVLKPFDDRELHVTIMMAMCKHRAFAELDRRVRERTEALARTEARYRRLQSVARLGLFALATPDTVAVMERAVSLVSETLDIELVEVLELQAGGDTLLLRAGVGWADGMIGRAVVGAHRASQGGYTLHASEPVVVSDIRRETRFTLPALLVDHGGQSGMSVVIHAPGPGNRPYGVLAAHSRRVRRYSENNVDFLQAVANVIATAIMRSIADAKVVHAERVAQEERVRASLAEDALRARDEFSSIAAHELRTPVAVLQLQMAAMRELLGQHGESLDPRILEKSDRAMKTIARLDRLVEQMLDVSRIALGSLELDTESFDLGELVRTMAAQHEELARRAGCELRVRIAEPVYGAWDRGRMEQVVANLLSNALKFGAGKPVELSLERHGPEARLRVRDHGMGIDPVDAARILRRFERAVSHRHYGGLGLGLYIAGHIVNEHGGRLEVSSTPGNGAAFTMVVPCDDGSKNGSGARTHLVER